MRVLHVTSSLDPVFGGVATAVATLAAAQRRAGLDVRVVQTWVTHPGTEIADQLRSQGVTVDLIQARDPRSWNRDLPRLGGRWAREHDVVHVHAMWEHIQYYAARGARRAGTPYVISPHGMIADWCMRKSGWPKRLYLAVRLRRNLDRATAIHYTSADERDATAWAGIRAPALLEPNGLDLSEFAHLPEKGAFRARIPQVGGRPFILMLGRINPKKGLDLLIPAFAQANLGDAMLVLAGPDSDGYRPQLESLARQHGVADRVVFTGMLPGRQRIEALVDADLFCLPSYNENFGIAVVESLAAGVPVVVSDQVNINRDIAEDRVGAVVPCDVGQLAAKLARWTNDRALREDAAGRARDAVRRRYDADAVARRWVRHYEAMVARAGAARGKATPA